MDSQKLLLYLVIGTAHCPEDRILDIVLESVEGGVTVVQLREKNAGDLYRIAKSLQEPLKRRGIPLILNDNVEIARELRADGVHLGQKDMPVAIARRLLGRKPFIGLSVESVGDAEQANASVIDYVAASPVFATASKSDTAPPLLLEGLAAIRKVTSLPIIGIGGINASNMASVLSAGANGIAVVSAILNSPNAKEAAKLLRSQIDAK